MADDNDNIVAAILAAGLLAREASNVTPGDQEQVPLDDRADHAVDLYRHCLSALQRVQ